MIKGGATLSKGESIAREVTELCALESGLYCEAYLETLSSFARSASSES
jgi:hypothetical protein